MTTIDPSAKVHPDAQIGQNCKIGPYCVIGPNVMIGDNNEFIASCYIGTPGQYRDRESKGGVVIGEGNRFHEGVTVHAAMGRWQNTRVGNDGYFMTNAHIAHDCTIEDGVTMCNNATLGGETHIMKGATLGFGAIVHQGQTIGAYSMLGMGAVVPKGVDIEPGEKYAGNPVKHIGRNTHALKKHNIRSTAEESARFAQSRPKKRDIGKLQKAVEQLQGYMQTRDRGYQARRYDIVRDVLPDIGFLAENDAALIYNMAFSLLWQQHEDFQADQIFIRELLIDSVTGGKMPEKGEAKGKIGWLVNHAALGTYAPWKHVYAYLSGMAPCDILIHGNVRKKEAEALMAMGHNIAHFKGTPEETTDAVRRYCEAQDIGVLISDIYLSTPLWAYMKRSAPLQTYLSPGFQLFPCDVLLLPETQEPIRCNARLPEIEHIPTAVLKEHLFQAVERKEPGKVFGVLSRAEKCSREYLEMVVAALDSVPGSEFHFYGRGELDIADPRFVAKGIQNAHEALANIDVYLDSYPTCSGLSAYEAMAHGVPVVTLDHESTASWNAFKPCVVNSKAQYIEHAIEALGRKGQEIAAAGREIVESRITNIPRAVEALYKGLERQGWQG